MSAPRSFPVDGGAHTAPVDVRQVSSVPTGWASAGIVDARAFSIGESERVHDVARAWPNRISAPCGASAPITETDGPRASWRDALPDCAACARTPRPAGARF